MSLVGPRPIVPEEIERYDGYAREFLSIKPGITGLWQVMGRSEIAYPERKYVDLIYVRNRSVYLDIKILLKTMKAVCTKTGAH
jgi:lipopolysaccharide/colanic/teichoic acid biosynthesis glycosyltransferase